MTVRNLRVHLRALDLLLPEPVLDEADIAGGFEQVRWEIWLEVVYGCVERGGVSLVG